MKCAHCEQHNTDNMNSLCPICSKASRCTACECFLTESSVSKPSRIVPGRCKACEDFENKIQEKCFGCGKFCDTAKMPLYRYTQRGNFCIDCERKADLAWPERLENDF